MLNVYLRILHDLSCRYNIRDLFEIYRSESDPAKVEELVATGWKHLETMKKLAAVDEHTLSQIFPGMMK